LQRKAVACGFYKRSSKLLPSKFFDILLYSASINGQFSLGQFSGEAAIGYDIPITKQGIDSRFDEKAVSFVKSILGEVIASQIGEPLNPTFLSKFNKVRIKDGTRFDLPQRLKEYFPGFGGKITSDAAACVQYEFDLKNRCLLDLDVTSAKRTDYQDAKETVYQIDKGDLSIRDLGYFSLDVLKSIAEKEAFFLSRLKPKMKVFDQCSREVNFSKLYSNMVSNQMPRVHIQAFIGEKERFPVRMSIELVPDEVYQKRILAVDKENKKKGQTTSEEFRIRARFNILVTNVSEEDLPVENMYNLYRTRWQIELVFKIWKSTIGISKLQPMKYHRFMCLLYAKFILFLVNSQIAGMMVRKLYDGKRQLSLDKAMKTLHLYFNLTREVLKSPHLGLTEYLDIMQRLLAKNHWLEKRKNKVGLDEIFDIFV
jgi:hypothetical protein